MLRKLIGAMFVMTVSLGLVFADQKSGNIINVKGTTITFQEMTKAKKGEKSEKVGDPIKLNAADAKVVKGKFNKDEKKFEAGDAIEGGLTSKAFADASEEKPVRVLITYEGKKVSEIITLQRGKKKNN